MSSIDVFSSSYMFSVEGNWYVLFDHVFYGGHFQLGLCTNKFELLCNVLFMLIFNVYF